MVNTKTQATHTHIPTPLQQVSATFFGSWKAKTFLFFLRLALNTFFGAIWLIQQFCSVPMLTMVSGCACKQHYEPQHVFKLLKNTALKSRWNILSFNNVVLRTTANVYFNKSVLLLFSEGCLLSSQWRLFWDQARHCLVCVPHSAGLLCATVEQTWRRWDRHRHALK